MKISVVQPDTIWEDKSKNFRRIEELISNIDGTDLIVLPEMFNTGFSMNTESLSEPPGSGTFKWMMNLAVKGNLGVCGSYIVKESDHFFNRLLFVTPDKNTWQYDKRHLFRMGDEEKYFTPGKARQIISFRGIRILPNICYDLRFPVWSRNRNDYDLLINSANWPQSRSEVWITLLKARAIENQCFAAGANRVGKDGAGIEYCGDSVIINPYGEILISASKYKECSVTTEISMDFLVNFRKKFPVFKDADDFTVSF